MEEEGTLYLFLSLSLVRKYTFFLLILFSRCTLSWFSLFFLSFLSSRYSFLLLLLSSFWLHTILVQFYPPPLAIPFRYFFPLPMLNRGIWWCCFLWWFGLPPPFLCKCSAQQLPLCSVWTDGSSSGVIRVKKVGWHSLLLSLTIRLSFFLSPYYPLSFYFVCELVWWWCCCCMAVPLRLM